MSKEWVHNRGVAVATDENAFGHTTPKVFNGSSGLIFQLHIGTANVNYANRIQCAMAIHKHCRPSTTQQQAQKRKKKHHIYNTNTIGGNRRSLHSRLLARGPSQPSQLNCSLILRDCGLCGVYRLDDSGDRNQIHLLTQRRM